MPLTAIDAVARRELDRPLIPREPVVTEPAQIPGGLPLSLLAASCPLCGDVEAFPLGVSEDFTYHVSPDAWLPLRCSGCGSVFVSPTPAPAMLSRLYPAQYYSQPTGPRQAGVLGGLQRRAEWRGLRRAIGSLDGELHIIDIGCGGGHHLQRLRAEGGRAVSLEGVDPSPAGVERARASGLSVQQGRIEDLALPAGRYDLALLIHTLEHLSDPMAALAAVHSALRPGGRVVVAVYNLSSPCYGLFRGRHWGGYDFPRQRMLYSEPALRLLADRTGFEWESAVTTPDSACWAESAYRLLSDWHLDWLSRRFGPSALVTGALFTAVEAVFNASARGGVLLATLRRPASWSSV